MQFAPKRGELNPLYVTKFHGRASTVTQFPIRSNSTRGDFRLRNAQFLHDYFLHPSSRRKKIDPPSRAGQDASLGVSYVIF
jgi:hypothetical protein